MTTIQYMFMNIAGSKQGEYMYGTWINLPTQLHKDIY